MCRNKGTLKSNFDMNKMFAAADEVRTQVYHNNIRLVVFVEAVISAERRVIGNRYNICII